MKNNRLIFTLFFLLMITNLKAQDALQQIREQYSIYTSQISNCENNRENCALFSNTQSTNSLDQIWRAVGKYQKETKFWYDDSPRNCNECGEEGINSLKMVSSDTKSGLATIYEEWLFVNGELAFFYLKELGEVAIEYRYYFDNGVLIRYVKNKEQLSSKTVPDRELTSIEDKAENLQVFFLLSFN